MILDNNKGNLLLAYFQTVIMENKMSFRIQHIWESSGMAFSQILFNVKKASFTIL